MSSIYVASSWRNQHQPGVVELLRAAGHDVYDFRNPGPGDNGFGWSEIDPTWKGWDVRVFRERLTHPRAKSGFGADLGGMMRSDTCVLVLPCGRSAHLEAGWFTGRDRRLVIYYPPGVEVEPELMYLLAGDPRACITCTEEELVAALRPPKRPPVLFYVEPDKLNRAAIERAAGELGYVVRCFSTSGAAVDALHAGELPAAVVTTWRNVDAVEVLEVAEMLGVARRVYSGWPVEPAHARIWISKTEPARLTTWLRELAEHPRVTIVVEPQRDVAPIAGAAAAAAALQEVRRDQLEQVRGKR